MVASKTPWQRIDTSGGPDACWPWQGGLDPDGYPRCSRNRRDVRVHRWVLEQTTGPIPASSVVRHTCDNRKCCNPRHLLYGTHADNVADRVARRRSATGTRNGRAKLTPEDAATIRTAYAEGWPVMELARHFGVDKGVIRGIVAGRLWAA